MNTFFKLLLIFAICNVVLLANYNAEPKKKSSCKQKIKGLFQGFKNFLKNILNLKKSETEAGGEINTYLESLNFESLKRLAVKIEKKLQKGMVIGGIHDYIRNMKKSEIIEYIKQKVNEHKDILDLLEIKTEGQDDLVAYIYSQDRDYLVKLALAFEKYDKESGKGHGGIHDYVFRLSEDEIRDYIKDSLIYHPEIDSIEKLNGLLQKSVSLFRSKLGDDNDLVEYLYTLDRKSLTDLAMAFEKYDSKSGQKHGGIHDYLFRLSDDEIREYIKDLLIYHPEINTVEKLKALLDQQVSMNMVGTADESDIVVYLYGLEKAELTKLALAFEKYDKKSGQHHGGIHDYITRIGAEEIRQYIKDLIIYHPEIDSVEKLKKLVDDFKKPAEALTFLGTPSNRVVDYINSLDDQKLKSIALSLEGFHRKATSTEGLLGGLHDYIARLSTQEVKDYIMKEVEEHQELQTLDNFKAISN